MWTMHWVKRHAEDVSGQYSVAPLDVPIMLCVEASLQSNGSMIGAQHQEEDLKMSPDSHIL